MAGTMLATMQMGHEKIQTTLKKYQTFASMT